jgi:hypothetical protein
MPWYGSCVVNNVGCRTDAGETPAPVVHINLTDTAGSFSDQWFYAPDGFQNQMLAVALAAMNGRLHVGLGAGAPNAGNTPHTAISQLYLNWT